MLYLNVTKPVDVLFVDQLVLPTICSRVGSGLGHIFGKVEVQRENLHILEYGVSQTSLEQVFNSFAAQQKEERGAVRGLHRPAAAAPSPPTGAASTTWQGASPATSSSQTVQVQIPAGVAPGQKLRISLSTGTDVEFVVPAGAVPGQLVNVPVSAS
eukprot:SAG31_NODE_753_length_12340_cov_8.786619_3_plen_156_part_00